MRGKASLVLNLKSRYFTINLCFLFSKLNASLYLAYDNIPDENLMLENQKLSKEPKHIVEKKTSRISRRHGK